MLHWAIGAGHQAIVELIVKALLGPLNRWDDSTALGEAVEKGYEAILEYLLQLGAKPPSSCLDDPLIIANDQTGSSLLQLLKLGIRPKSDVILCHVARRNDIVSLQLWVDFGVEIADGVRPDYQDLQLALKLKFSEAVAILEHLSYKEVPEKMAFENFVRQREEKRLADPDFQPMEWEPYVGLCSPYAEEHGPDPEEIVCSGIHDDEIHLDDVDFNVYLADAGYTTYSER
ncbi:hypothetical protein N7471_011264 [Penicillium samsonianum]|uniref:uncharacterized protein n=1 Tax=Penicillium samsonianum TaxID=1882272 RepID=UPI0025491E26|nr:uncharacterized protein N7471_011264 [Penicillium samsonianum]KAJ6123947.1 hypothetical protein N7471_011264 [Penicillium samsonianum]